MNDSKAKALAAIEALGLTMTTEFVPWSESRNAGPKQPSLNWLVTIKRNGKDVLTTDYMAGCGHCPSYRQQMTVHVDRLVRIECETGSSNGKRIEPDVADVLHSLVSDAEVLDHSTFKSWASDLGYDPDSRKAEAIYRACLDIGLKLRNGIGEDGLKQLREALQDY